ncbi:serine protease [Stieleria varia]|uniref:Serine protease n=1 Tax=Stieleria varia TaxID=2528005 RepID=A0A5C6A3P9_9BACT|nr:serine protease [Stieleria varia]TWT93967.1 hypothetical protein Pla52n_57960 [Stieleria varia]
MLGSPISPLNCLISLCVCLSSVVAGEVKLERFFPPVVTLGSDSKLVAEGDLSAWPMDFECDRAEVRITASPDEKNTLTFTTDANAAPGVAWIRVNSQNAISAWTPVLMTSAAVTVESEPNNEIGNAGSLDLPTVVAGRLAKNGDVDSYRIKVTDGQTLVVAAVANEILASPMDAVLQIVDLDGNVLAQSDDDCGLDPLIVHHVGQDTELVIRIFAFPETPNSTIALAGSSSFVYAINVTTGPIVDHGVAASDGRAEVYGWNLPEKVETHVSPATTVSPPTLFVPETLGWTWDRSLVGGPRVCESSNAAAQQVNALPATLFGHISEQAELDRFIVPVVAQKKYWAQVRSYQYGFPLDSHLKIIDRASSEILASNEDLERGRYDAATTFEAKTDGFVEIHVSDRVDGHGDRHFYYLTVEQYQPVFELSVTSDRFVLTKEKPLEIPVTVKRLPGFSGVIEISVEGLPEFVTSEQVKSEPKGGTSKSVQIKLSTTEPIVNVLDFRIIGRQSGDETPTGDQQPVHEKALFRLRPSLPISALSLTGQ